MSGENANPRTLVVGIGNPDRCDDGLGPAVIRHMRDITPSYVTLRERPGDVLALIDEWQGYERVILVDAAANHGVPGTIRRVDLARDDVPRDLSLGSTHAFGVAEAVALARALGRLPEHMIVYAVEADEFGYGATLSASVAAAVPVVANRICAEIENCGARGLEEKADA